MRVGFDARMIHHSGIGTAIRGWLRGLALLPSSERPRLVLIGDPMHLADYAGPLEAPIIPFTVPIYSLSEQARFPHSRDRWDLLFVPHYAHPLFYDEPFIGTVCDRFHIKYGSPAKRAYQHMMLSRLKSRRCPVVTISSHVREELIHEEGFAPGRVHVVTLGLEWADGVTAGPASIDKCRKALTLPERYVLWVGIRQPHKNLPQLLKAFHRSVERIRMPLVLAGVSTADAGILRREIEALGLEKSVIVIERFDESLKLPLFAGASAFVFPSLDEGFGLPPLEAMAAGIPCAVSNRPPMNELYGECCVGFDPDSETPIAEALIEVTENESRRECLAMAGREKAREFSCRRSAQELVHVWQNCPATALQAVRA